MSAKNNRFFGRRFRRGLCPRRCTFCGKLPSGAQPQKKPLILYGGRRIGSNYWVSDFSARAPDGFLFPLSPRNLTHRENENTLSVMFSHRGEANGPKIKSCPALYSSSSPLSLYPSSRQPQLDYHQKPAIFYVKEKFPLIDSLIFPTCHSITKTWKSFWSDAIARKPINGTESVLARP